MKEHPILFSAPMVRALLNGSKTQTRRVVKPQSDEHGLTREAETWPDNWHWFDSSCGLHRCPYGAPGDALWVKETFCVFDEGRVHYRAHFEHDPKGEKTYGVKWSPSIFMPRWASRITLEIIDVRVERVQDISESDAMAEGVDMETPVTLPFSNAMPWATVTYKPRSAKDGYAALWETINGAGSWNANPWVWVIEFKRLLKEENGNINTTGREPTQGGSK